MKQLPILNTRPPAILAPMRALMVTAIIGLLISLTLGAMDYAGKTALRNKTVMTHRALLLTLENYKTEFLEYPAASNPTRQAMIDGREFAIGGATMLYQMMSGDGSNEIARTKDTGKPSDGTVENDDPARVMMDLADLPWKEAGGQRYVADAYGHPFQYMRADEPGAVNETFDLWSYAGEAGASGKRDAAAKADAVAARRWITNFQPVSAPSR